MLVSAVFIVFLIHGSGASNDRSLGKTVGGEPAKSQVKSKFYVEIRQAVFGGEYVHARSSVSDGGETTQYSEDYQYEYEVGVPLELTCTHDGFGWRLRWIDSYGVECSTKRGEDVTLAITPDEYDSGANVSCVADQHANETRLTITFVPRLLSHTSTSIRPDGSSDAGVVRLQVGARWSNVAPCYGRVLYPGATTDGRTRYKQLLLPTFSNHEVIESFRPGLNGTIFFCTSYYLKETTDDISMKIIRIYERVKKKVTFHIDGETPTSVPPDEERSPTTSTGRQAKSSTNEPAPKNTEQKNTDDNNNDDVGGGLHTAAVVCGALGVVALVAGCVLCAWCHRRRRAAPHLLTGSSVIYEEIEVHHTLPPLPPPRNLPPQRSSMLGILPSRFSLIGGQTNESPYAIVRYVPNAGDNLYCTLKFE